MDSRIALLRARGLSEVEAPEMLTKVDAAGGVSAAHAALAGVFGNDAVRAVCILLGGKS